MALIENNSRHFERAASIHQKPFRNYALLPNVIAFLALSYIAVVLRLWTRIRYLKRLGWDDYTIIASLTFFTVYCGSVITIFALAGYARSISDMRLDRVNEVAQLLIAAEVFYILTMIALKLSLGIFFLRVLVARWQCLVIMVTIAVSTIFGGVYLFFAIFQCGWYTDISVFILRLVTGRCASMSLGLGINYTYAGLSTISDFICGLTPIFVLREAKMPMRRKVVVGGLMVFAALGSVASVARMIYLKEITNPIGDYFVNISKLSLWSTIEPGTGITVASLATLRPLFRKVLDKTRHSSALSRSSNLESSERQGQINPESDANESRTKSVGCISNSTTLVPSSPHGLKFANNSFSKSNPRISREENIADIEAEMCAYGMSDVNKCTILEEEDFSAVIPKRDMESDRRARERWYQSQRAMRRPTLNETTLGSLSPEMSEASGSRALSPEREGIRREIEVRIEYWSDDFKLDV